jgi:signal transduction histidine kinase
MKNSSGDRGRRPAFPALLVGACLAVAGLAGLGFAFRKKAQSATAAEEMLALHRARVARQALRAQRLEHDMRSPVGAMAVALELLRTSDDSDTRREAMQVLERQVVRMTSLTEQMHQFAQALND